MLAIGQAMARSGDYITPRLWGSPWFEKPPLLYWMTAAGTLAGFEPGSCGASSSRALEPRFPRCRIYPVAARIRVRSRSRFYGPARNVRGLDCLQRSRIDRFAARGVLFACRVPGVAVIARSAGTSPDSLAIRGNRRFHRACGARERTRPDCACRSIPLVSPPFLALLVDRALLRSPWSRCHGM